VTTPSIILLDIEGTAAPISFVYETLLPYARRHLRQFLADHTHDPGVREDLDLLASENHTEQQSSSDAPEFSRSSQLDAAYNYLIWLMDQDRKSPALKSIQGKIWAYGYTSGELRSTLFPDVAPALKRWHWEGRRVAIYSSGSVLAQKLLFRYTDFGDLSPWIDAYFDTAMGAKTQSESYNRIAEALAANPAAGIFLSDSIPELAAASSAGWDVRLAIRPGNRPVSDSMHYLTLASFDELA
jgi:enolase-phosphatase E1